MIKRFRRTRHECLPQYRLNVNAYLGFEGVCKLKLNLLDREKIIVELNNINSSTKAVGAYTTEKNILITNTKSLFTLIDEYHLENIITRYKSLYYDAANNRVRTTSKETSKAITLCRVIKEVIDPNIKIHHMNTDTFNNCDRNLLPVSSKQHSDFHTTIQNIQKKTKYDDKRLILELSENVIAKMQDNSYDEYEKYLLKFENQVIKSSKLLNN